MIAALYVQRGGCYYGLPHVDPWDEERDARLYAGPWPVVAHPPCARWGNFATGGPAWLSRGKEPKRVGDDGGCFTAALASVRRWGGVLEHPAGSKAWAAHGILAPLASGGWCAAGDGMGMTCAVEQGHYGHRARKATWLYAAHVALPALQWGRSAVRPVPVQHSLWGDSDVERRRVTRMGAVGTLSKARRAATPPAFRDLLIEIAQSAHGAREVA